MRNVAEERDQTCRAENCNETLVEDEGYDGLCGGCAHQHGELQEMQAVIRSAFPLARETVVACDGVWLTTDDGRFVSIGPTLAEAADLARTNDERARLVRNELEQRA